MHLHGQVRGVVWPGGPLHGALASVQGMAEQSVCHDPPWPASIAGCVRERTCSIPRVAEAAAVGRRSTGSKTWRRGPARRGPQA